MIAMLGLLLLKDALYWNAV